MAETNTISNLDNITSLAYNDVFAIDDLNALDIFGAPITKNVSALQLSNYINRSFGAATYIATCDLVQIAAFTATYSNGTLGVGATLTNAGTQAALVVDGVTAVVGYRIVYGGGTFQNGIYTVTTVGTASTNWVLTRATDYDTASEILLGTFTSIQRGATLIGRTYIQANTSITVGTTSIVFQSLQSTIMSTAASLAIGGTGGNFFLGSGGGIFTLPTGTKTIYGTGDAPTYGALSFTNGTGIKTGTTAGDVYLFTAYDVDGAGHRTFGTFTANNIPTLDFSPPAGGLLTLTKSVGTGGVNIIPSGSLHLNLTPVGNITTGEDTLMTVDLTADTLITTNQYLEWEVAGTNANNINAKVIKVYFGGTLLLTLTQPVSTANGWWRAKVTITRTGLNTQAWEVEAGRIATGGGSTLSNTSGTCAETETSAITMKCTGEAVATDDIIQIKSTIKNFAG